MNSTIAINHHQHKGCTIDLTETPNGITATCTNNESITFIRARSTRAEALYVAIRTIDAQEIAAKIDGAVDLAQCPDAVANQVTELVSQLVGMISA